MEEMHAIMADSIGLDASVSGLISYIISYYITKMTSTISLY